jgi:hypothetical protein
MNDWYLIKPVIVAEYKAALSPTLLINYNTMHLRDGIASLTKKAPRINIQGALSGYYFFY